MTICAPRSTCSNPPEPVELPALDERDFRRQVFGALLKRANAGLEAPAQGADPEFDRLLADRKWAGDPLYLMMAGLAAGKAGVRGALALSRADLALTVARNELDRIGRIGAARGIDIGHPFPGAFVRHMAAIATLSQGLTLGEARDIATREIVCARLDGFARCDDRRVDQCSARVRGKRRRRADPARRRRRGRCPHLVRVERRTCDRRRRSCRADRRRSENLAREDERNPGADGAGFRRSGLRRAHSLARGARRRQMPSSAH